MFNLEGAISRWRQEMAAGGIKNAQVLDELESHLRDDVDQRVRAGLSQQRAFETAIQRMGQATVLRAEFEKTDNAKRVRLRKCFLRCFGIAVGCFTVSVSLCYLVILPVGLRANERYASWLGIHGPQPSFDFVCRFTLGMGLALVVPVGLLILVRVGILNHTKLISLRRYLIVANLILGAVLTTPEVVTQIVMFVSLQSLCEASIWIARIRERKELEHA